MQTKEVSGVDVLLAFRAAIGGTVRLLLYAAFGVASTASDFSNPFGVLAISFRRLDTYQSYALVPKIN